MIRCDALLQHFFKNDTWKVHLLAQWPHIVGNLADKMRIEEIKEDTIIIGVFQSSWLQELYSLSPVIKKIINEALKEQRIKTIRFKYATPRESKTQHVVLQQSEVAAMPPIILTNKEKQALSRIKDKELSDVLHAFLSRCHYRKIHS